MNALLNEICSMILTQLFVLCFSGR